MGFLDWLYGGVVAPLFSWLGWVLQVVLLGPLSAAGLPLWFQVVVVGGVVAALSGLIRHGLGVEEKERLFQVEFARRRGCQEAFKRVTDWRLQQLLYRASDQELDELYNQFVARKFAYFGLTYLVPIFLALFWLDHLYPRDELMARYGSPFLVRFPAASPLPGLSVPLCFFIGFVVGGALIKVVARRMGPRGSMDSKE